MANLPRGRTKHLVAAALLACGIAPFPAAGAEVDLIGTWYVLVHYTDDNTANPETPRWEDRVWEFQTSGSRLRWLEWPIVVFGDESGRFERRSTGQYARIRHFWEPNAGQLENIRGGLSVNDRGSKSKTLRKREDGWRSGTRPTASSVRVITYQETWSIEYPDGLPVFSRLDSLGSGETEGMDGVTEYRTTEVRDGGNVLFGTFERDGTRHGTFRLTRAGAHKDLQAKSQKELQEQAQRRSIQGSATARQEIRKSLESALEKEGISVDEAELDALVEEAVDAFAGGASEREAARRALETARERHASD